MNTSLEIPKNPEALLKLLDELSDPALWKTLNIIEKDLAREKLRILYELILLGPLPGKFQDKSLATERNSQDSDDINPVAVDEHIHLSETDTHEIETDELLSDELKENGTQKTEKSDKSQPDLFSLSGKSKKPASKEVNESISGNKQPESIADKIQKEVKIERLKTAIGINEKFFFINELFDGNLAAYNEAIDVLDNTQTVEEAKARMNDLAGQYHWEGHEEAKDQLWLFIEQKFK